MTQPTHPDLDALDKLIDAVSGWKWETVQGDQFGHFEEGSFYDIGTVDADQYAVGEETHNETILNFIAAFNPQTCRALLDRLRKAEAAIAQTPGCVIVKITMADAEYAEVSPELILEDALRVATYGWPAGVSFEVIAAPASTPTDSADSEGAKG